LVALITCIESPSMTSLEKPMSTASSRALQQAKASASMVVCAFLDTCV